MEDCFKYFIYGFMKTLWLTDGFYTFFYVMLAKHFDIYYVVA